MSRALVAVALLLALVLPRPARADDDTAQVTAARRSEARDHYQRGKALQAERAYAEAIVEYEAGYALVTMPEFLFNIGQCYRLMDDKAKAVDYYRRYLEAAPAGKGASEARAHIEKLELELRPAPPPAPAPTPPPKPVVTTPAKPPVDLSVKPPPQRRKRIGAWQIGGLSSMGAGLVVAGLGTYFAVHGRRLSSEVEETLDPDGSWTPALHAKYDEGIRSNLYAKISFVAAGALVVGGAATYWFGPRPMSPALEPTIGPGHVGISFTTSF